MLLAIVVGLCSGVVEIDNGSSAILLSWVSDISKSTFPISLDNRETSVNFEQVGSSTLFDENGESGDALNLMVFLEATPSLAVIFWSLMLVPPSIFSF